MSEPRTVSLHNTLSRTVEAVRPLKAGEISLYSCGPTVYNFAHIGNLRTFLLQDLLKRTFLAAGYRVRHCMNLTDVEDKIIRASQADLPPDAPNGDRHAAMRTLTECFTTAFLEDLDALAILRPTFMPKATDYIPQMIALIQGLEAKGLAYVRDGSVYYRIAGFPAYGRLAHLDRAGMRTGTSVDADEYERDAVQDFALWKATRPGEPHWDSPWGAGRPGWHIECSAMGIELLGDRIDLHSGGVDLTFPHHENEIAQSEGHLGHPWVTTWVHGEFLQVDGAKMAKSQGNFHTLRDLVAQGVDPIAFRFAILSNHYRKALNFSPDNLKASEGALKRIRAFRQRMERDDLAPAAPSVDGVSPLEVVAKTRDGFWKALTEDLNTPEALAQLFTLISALNVRDATAPLSRTERDAVLAFLDETDGVFAAWPRGETALDAEVEGLIAQRLAAKAARDWAEADRIRAALKAMGILLEDRKDGTTGWRQA
jgi:cysteinyl-tRNA synthetase